MTPEELVCSAGRLGHSEAAVQRLAGEMLEELSGMGHSADAAALAADYLSDADNAVALLSQARQWREALRVAYRCGMLFYITFHCYILACHTCPVALHVVILDVATVGAVSCETILWKL